MVERDQPDTQNACYKDSDVALYNAYLALNLGLKAQFFIADTQAMESTTSQYLSSVYLNGEKLVKFNVSLSMSSGRIRANAGAKVLAKVLVVHLLI